MFHNDVSNGTPFALTGGGVFFMPCANANSSRPKPVASDEALAQAFG